MTIRPATRARIEAAHRFSAFYRESFASHLPMALIALDGMGADDPAIAAFADRYEAAHLEPLGQDSAEWESVRHFEGAIARDGLDATVRGSLDRLAPAIGCAAFHGAIRTAYALESGSNAEVAHALAYWTGAYAPLPAVDSFTGSATPFEALTVLAADRDLAGHRAAGRSIAARMRAAAADPRFGAWASRVDPGRLDIDSVASALIQAYAATGNFTLLHGVTGAHAVRVLLPYASAAHRMLSHFWTAVVAAFVGEGAPAPVGWKLSKPSERGWTDVHAAAVRCPDEHDVKLAYSCWREWQHRGDDLYRQVASAVACVDEPARAGEPC